MTVTNMEILQPLSGRGPVSAHRHELELDVVGVSEHEYRVAALVVDRRVLDSQFGELRLPGVQLGATGHHEADMVESGPRLQESLAFVGWVRVQPDAHRPVRLAEHDGVTAAVGV